MKNLIGFIVSVVIFASSICNGRTNIRLDYAKYSAFSVSGSVSDFIEVGPVMGSDKQDRYFVAGSLRLGNQDGFGTTLLFGQAIYTAYIPVTKENKQITSIEFAAFSALELSYTKAFGRVLVTPLVSFESNSWSGGLSIGLGF